MSEENNKKKSCIFFASDYHFEMISLPYINKKLKNNKEVIILTENNLEKTIQKLLKGMGIKEEEKQQILEIGWKENNYEKVNNANEATIFIKGSKNYIENVNKKIKMNNNLEVIDCYDINEVGMEAKNISNQYEEVLATTNIK